MSLHKTLPREDTVGGQGEMEEGSRDVQKVPQITIVSRLAVRLEREPAVMTKGRLLTACMKPVEIYPPVKPEGAIS